MRLLLIEDDELLGEGLRDYLRADGHRVDWAHRLADTDAWRGEPFRSAIAPDAVPALLRRHGFTLISSATPADLAEGVTLQGENLVHCRAL